MRYSSIQLITCIDIALLVTTSGQQLFAEPTRVAVQRLQSDGETCPLAGDTARAINEFTEYTRNNIFEPCGSSSWTRVAFLNMTDPNTSCPAGLTLDNYPGRRMCGLPQRTPPLSIIRILSGSTLQVRKCGTSVSAHSIPDIIIDIRGHKWKCPLWI